MRYRRLAMTACLLAACGSGPGCASTKSAGSPFGMATTPPQSGWSKFTAAVSAPFKKKQPESSQLDKNDATSVFAPPKKLNADFYVSVARMQERGGNASAAAASYQKAIQMEPNNAAALLDYAHLQDRQGAFAEATKLYEKVVTQQPKNAAAQNDLGLCLARQGEMDQAVSRLKQAVTLQPDRKLYRNNLATVLVEVGRTDEALQQLSAAHPPEIAHYNLGYLLTQSNQNAAAARQFEAALQANPQFAEARQWLDTLAQQSAAEAAPLAQAAPQAAQPAGRYAAQVPLSGSPPDRLPKALLPGQRYDDSPPSIGSAHGSLRIAAPETEKQREIAPQANDADAEAAPSPDDLDDYDSDRYEARNSGWSNKSPTAGRL